MQNGVYVNMSTVILQLSTQNENQERLIEDLTGTVDELKERLKNARKENDRLAKLREADTRDQDLERLKEKLREKLRGTPTIEELTAKLHEEMDVSENHTDLGDEPEKIEFEH